MVVDNEKFEIIADQVLQLLSQANEDGTLHSVLQPLGLQGLIDPDDDFDTGMYDEALGDVLVLGKLELKKDMFQMFGYKRGYSKSRFHFVDYDDAANYDCSGLRGSSRYAAIMCGPLPHKMLGMGDTNSFLEAARHPENGYPPLAELHESSGEGALRINKTTFLAGLDQLEQMGAIKPDRL